jgi:drug/metabolite transporter (DMT)-like permease
MFSKSDIEKYFVAEKSESLLFLVLGLLAISLSIIFYSYLKSLFFKGAAIPLLVIGIIQAIVGYTVYSRSDQQRVSLVYAYDMDPGKIKNEELPRMQKVNERFVIYRWVEISFIAIGLVMIFLYRNNPGQQFLFGIGLTLALQAAIMLSADYFAERRAAKYTLQIRSFVSKPTSGI